MKLDIGVLQEVIHRCISNYLAAFKMSSNDRATNHKPASISILMAFRDNLRPIKESSAVTAATAMVSKEVGLRRLEAQIP